MSDLDAEQTIYGLALQIETLSCARPEQLAPALPELEAIQDNIAQAIAKARTYSERKAA